LDIDSVIYWKIERGERYAKKEYIPIIAELLMLWLAGQAAAEKRVVE